MTTMRLFAPLFVLIAISLALTAHAETLDEQHPLAADGRLSVSNVSGSIQISTWDRNEVRISGEIDSDASHLEITGDPSNLRMAVRPVNKSSDRGSAELDLRVPAGARIDIDSVSANVSVQGVKGTLKVSSVSGDVVLSVSSPDIAVDTVSGDLALAAPSANTRIGTVSGDVAVSGVRGVVKLETVSGDVQLRGGDAFSQVGLKTVSGDLHFEGALTGDAKLDGQSLSGSIIIKLADPASAQATIHSFSGDVRTDFGSAAPAKEKDLEVKIGDGRGRISLSSFSGDIDLLKR